MEQFANDKNTPDAQYRTLHRLYGNLTGNHIAYREGEHDQAWFRWAKRFDEADLRAVVGHLRKLYRDKKEILIASLRFRHLITQLDYFEEYLAEARNQPRPPTEREKVMADAGMQEEIPEAPPQRAGDVAERILKGQDFLDAMKYIRENL